jgi:hypothetical protein
MCDVKILLSGGVQTVAHSCVLSAASPFFKSLLQHVPQTEIDTSSFPSEVIQEVLSFIYTGDAVFSMADLLLAHQVAAIFNIVSLMTLIQDMLLQHDLEPSDHVSDNILSGSTVQTTSDRQTVRTKEADHPMIPGHTLHGLEDNGDLDDPSVQV